MIERLQQNWYPMPNQLNQMLIGEEKGSTIRVVLFIAEKTIGLSNEVAQDQKGVEVPYSQLTKFMSSASVSKGLKDAVEKKYVIKLSSGNWKDWEAARYKLNFTKLQSLESKEYPLQTLKSKDTLESKGNNSSIEKIRLDREATQKEEVDRPIFHKCPKCNSPLNSDFANWEGQRYCLECYDKLTKPPTPEFITCFKDTFGRTLKHHQIHTIEDFFRDPGINQDFVTTVISKMTDYQDQITDPAPYLIKIISNLTSKGIKTVQQLVRADIQNLIKNDKKKDPNHFKPKTDFPFEEDGPGFQEKEGGSFENWADKKAYEMQKRRHENRTPVQEHKDNKEKGFEKLGNFLDEVIPERRREN
jgi:hypothetical protein